MPQSLRLSVQMTITADDLEGPELAPLSSAPAHLVPPLISGRLTTMGQATADDPRSRGADPVHEPGLTHRRRNADVFDEKHYAPQAWQLLHNFG